MIRNNRPQPLRTTNGVNPLWPPLGDDPFAPEEAVASPQNEHVWHHSALRPGPQRLPRPFQGPQFSRFSPYVLVSVNYLIYLPAPECGTDKA